MKRSFQISDEEITILIDDIYSIHGYDFSGYAKASLKRRIARLAMIDRFPSFAEFRYRLVNDVDYLRRFVEEITVNVTEMFRDPSFYKAIKEEVFPVLATYPVIRIWHAGCATGEEVYSLAILLKEARLLHKSLLYATDINPAVLSNLKAGIFPGRQVRNYAVNYLQAGGVGDFSNYYTAHYDRIKFEDELSGKIIVSTHNLVSDRSFNEFHLILCRNVLIYFEKSLQKRAFNLFDKSLHLGGFLGLGSKETIQFSGIAEKYIAFAGTERLWRKVK